MENASKALLMAAGILIGLILLTAGMYLFNTIRASQEAKYLNVSEEQLLAYNAEFESYDKQRMYGTDVITVLNKAIDLNTQNEWYSNKDYQIDVTFKLETTVENYIIPYKKNPQTHKMEQQNRIHADTQISYKLYGINEKQKTYSILNKSDLEEINDFLDTQTEKSEYILENKTKKDKGGNIEYYEMYYTGFSDFKRKIFKCTNVDYNSLGKISKMEFEEIPASELNSKNKLK